MSGGPKPSQHARTTPLAGIPDPPKGLNAESRRHWNSVTDLIHRAGVLSHLDTDALTVFVSIFAQWKEASRKVAEQGAVIEGRNGVCLNPWQKIKENSAKELRAYFDIFGLSPKARAALTVQADEVVDPKWAKLNGG